MTPITDRLRNIVSMCDDAIVGNWPADAAIREICKVAEEVAALVAALTPQQATVRCLCDTSEITCPAFCPIHGEPLFRSALTPQDEMKADTRQSSPSPVRGTGSPRSSQSDGSEPRRAETGPMKFGDDWTGLFVRGDNAFGYAMALRHMRAQLTGFDVVQIDGLLRLFARSDEQTAGDAACQRMKPFDEAQASDARPTQPDGSQAIGSATEGLSSSSSSLPAVPGPQEAVAENITRLTTSDMCRSSFASDTEQPTTDRPRLTVTRVEINERAAMAKLSQQAAALAAEATRETEVIMHAIGHWHIQGGEAQFGEIGQPQNADELISAILSVVRAPSPAPAAGPT